MRRWSTLDVFYTESGAYPVAGLTPSWTWEAGPLRWVTSPVVLHVVFASCLLVALAFTLGLGTRFVKWLLLPTLFALDSRTPHLYTGGELVLHGQALYAVLLPIGHVLSLDSWRRSRHPSVALDVKPTAVSSPFYLVLLLQLSVIYFFNQRAKMMGVTWHDGSAMAKALAGPSLVTSLGVMVSHFPPIVLRGFTYGAMVVEGVLPFLLLSPWARKWTHALAGALMLALHAGIHVTLEIGSFSAAMLSYLPLLWHPHGEADRVVVPTRGRRRLEMVVAAGLIYVGAGRLSRDLILWPERPQLPMPRLLDRATVALGLWQPWMMFAPDPPPSDYLVVTDAVTRKGLHFDPWQQRAGGGAEPLKEWPQSAGRHHSFAAYELYLTRGADPQTQSFFSQWVLRQRGPDQAPVERFDAWFLIVSTDPRLVVEASELEGRVGVSVLPLDGALSVTSFEATSIWTPERAFDHRIAPEGTNVMTPVSAVMSTGCPHLTLDFGEPHRLESAFVQASSGDLLWIEGSLDNQNFRPLAQTQGSPDRQLRSQVLALPGEPSRYVRLRPIEPGKSPHFLSEAAFFEHAIALPPLASRSSEDFYSALARPAIAGVISGTNSPHAQCPR
jgi:hypothetical protein